MVRKSQAFSGGVSFGGVSIGEKTARIGIRVDRGVMELNQADEYFCDRRLTGKVVLGRFDESSGQRKLIDDVDHQISGSFDVRGFRCSTDVIATGLTFGLNDIDIAELARFSKGEGRLVINDVGEIPAEEKAERSGSPDHVPGSLKADGPWKDHPLDSLFDPGKTLRKALAAAGINTVGELANYTASERRLTDIDGIGPGKAQEIEDRLMDYWKDNPGADKK